MKQTKLWYAVIWPNYGNFSPKHKFAGLLSNLAPLGVVEQDSARPGIDRHLDAQLAVDGNTDGDYE